MLSASAPPSPPSRVNLPTAGSSRLKLGCPVGRSCSGHRSRRWSVTAARYRAYAADHGLRLGRLRSGSPALALGAPLFEAADSAFTLRRVRHPTSGSTCRTQGQLRSLGRRGGSFGRISACPATAVTLLTHYAKRGFELKMSVWRSPVRAVVDEPELPLLASRRWTAYPPSRRSPSCGSTTTHTRSRRRGSVGTRHDS